MRRALGKGLAQMLGDHEEQNPTDVSVGSISTNPRQPRHEFAEEPLQELTNSIKEHGIIQPLVVRTLSNGNYELIAGERRLRAAKLAGLKTVPVVVRTASAQASLEIALIENVQRESINPIECAKAYSILAHEFSLNQEQIATKVGKSRAAIANCLRLLKLPPEIQEAVQTGTISEGHARALLMVDSPTKLQAIFKLILDQQLSVRETERLARSEPRIPSEAPAPKPSKGLEPDWETARAKLSEYLGANVQIARKNQGGKLTIEFFSEDEMEGLIQKMGLRL